MEIKKWVPWNWFNKEEESTGHMVPVKREDRHHANRGSGHPLQEFHREFDRLFDRTFGDFGVSTFGFDRPFARMKDDLFRPTLDLGATDKEYTVTVEVPGVDEKDVKLEILNDTLTIRGEKKHEDEEKGKDFYRVERSYGSFQRVLSLPEDVDQDGVKATFKKGVLTVTLPRKEIPRADVKQIAVKSE